MENKTDPKIIAIISYITIIGWVIALLLHQNNRSELGAFHIRQTLGLFLTGLILSFIPIIGWILGIIVFVFWIIGLINAINGEMKPVPVVGKLYQDIFRGMN